MVAGALVGITQFVDRMAGFNQRLEQSTGTAVETSMGRDLSSAYSGKAPSAAGWMGERGRAAGLADQRQFMRSITDRVMGVIGTAMVGVGIGATALSGGALGVPGGALAAGGGAILANDRYRSSIFNQDAYRKMQAEEHGKDFWSNLEAFKQQDPRKRLMLENFDQNYMGDLNTQRNLGINNNQFYGNGGLLDQTRGAGFTREQGTGMANDIVAQGGSARMAQQAPFGLQMQRAGITNASKILGTISGGVESPQAGKEATIRILSEAFKIGLDNSNYVEETRRFTQAAAEVIGRTGAASGSSQDNLVQTLGMFLGQRTNAGVQSAQTAYQEYQQRGSQVGGRRGVMRYSEALQNSHLSQLDPMELTELLAATPEQLQSNPAVLEFYTQKGKYNSSGDLLKDLDKIRARTRFQIPKVRSKVKEYAETVARYMKRTGTSLTDLNQQVMQGRKAPGNLMDMVRGQGLPQDVVSALGGMEVYSNMEEGGGQNNQLAMSRAGELLKDTDTFKGDQSLLDMKKAQDVLSAPTGRVEDEWIKGIANSADVVRTNFNELKTVIEKAAGAAGALANSANSAAAGQGRFNNQRKDVPLGDANNTAARGQTQGGVPNSGEDGN